LLLFRTAVQLFTGGAPQECASIRLAYALKPSAAITRGQFAGTDRFGSNQGLQFPLFLFLNQAGRHFGKWRKSGKRKEFEKMESQPD
jgi:hypothetical protein